MDYCFLEFTSGRPIILDIDVRRRQERGELRGPPHGHGEWAARRPVHGGAQDGVVPAGTMPTPGYNIASGKTAWGIWARKTCRALPGIRARRRSRPRFRDDQHGPGAGQERGRYGRGDDRFRRDRAIARHAACCATDPAQFEIRVSQESKRIYVTDRQCRTISALQFVTRHHDRNSQTDCTSSHRRLPGRPSGCAMRRKHRRADHGRHGCHACDGEPMSRWGCRVAGYRDQPRVTASRVPARWCRTARTTTNTWARRCRP